MENAAVFVIKVLVWVFQVKGNYNMIDCKNRMERLSSSWHGKRYH